MISGALLAPFAWVESASVRRCFRSEDEENFIRGRLLATVEIGVADTEDIIEVSKGGVYKSCR